MTSTMISIARVSKSAKARQHSALATCLFGILIAAGIMLGGAAFVSKQTAQLYDSQQGMEDKFAFIEVLPLELVAEISNIVDERPLIDRLTVEMISEIPLEPEVFHHDDLSPQLDY